MNEVFRTKFLEKGWIEQPQVFAEISDIATKIDYLKDRVGVEVAFSHSSFIGIDLLKFQTLSYSNLDKRARSAVHLLRILSGSLCKTSKGGALLGTETF